MANKKEFKERFERLFKDCVIYCAHFNGFSHTVFYKDKEGKRHVGVYSGYASSCEAEDEHLCEDGTFRAYCTDRLKALFLGYAHYSYSHGQAQEIVYKDVSLW